MKNIEDRWDRELHRRMEWKRRQWAKEHAEIALLVALMLGIIAIMYFWNKYQPLRERAAYLEGRYDIDHQTAFALAESEVR